MTHIQNPIPSQLVAKIETPNATTLVVSPNLNSTPATDAGGELVVPTTDEDDYNSDNNDEALIPDGLYHSDNKDNIISEMFLEDAVDSESVDDRDEVEVLMDAVESTLEDDGDEVETESEGEVDSGDTKSVTTVQRVYPWLRKGWAFDVMIP